MKSLFSIAIVVMAFSVASCSHQRRIEKAAQTLISDTLAAAKYCGAWFPSAPTIVYKPGDTTIITETVVVRDTTVEVICPPAAKDTVVKRKIQYEVREVEKLRVDTLEITKPDSTYGKQKELELREANKAIAKLQHKVEQQRVYVNWFWWIVVIAAISIGAWFYVKVKTGALTKTISALKNKISDG